MQHVIVWVKAHKIWTAVVIVALIVIASAAGGGRGKKGSDKLAETAAQPPSSASVSDSPSPSDSLSPSSSPSPTSSAQAAETIARQTIASAPPSTALAAVGGLVVKGRAPMTGYSRAQFGQAWFDYDRNGCDTRDDILRRDLKDLSIKAGTNGCKVLSGDDTPDPYTGQPVHFVYGGASEVDIDHVVALGDAWQTGAFQWTAQERLHLANDPLNLLAADASANRQKGDADAASWLPANKSYRCDYVARQVAVKRTYSLWVTAAERDAMVRVLSTCPQQALPSGGNVALAAGPAPVQTHTAVPAAPLAPVRTTQAPPPPPPAVSGTDPRFGTCKEANANGYGPYYEGKDPEYDWYQDRDHDGIDCER